MAKIEFLPSFFNLIVSISVFLSLLNAANGIPEEELDALLSALRANGYHLFSDAALISDLRLLILSGSYFTIFAPSDGALFNLHSSVDAFDHGSILRYHVVRGGYYLEIEQPVREGWGWETYFLTVDGASVFFPEIFYGPSVAVHGLDGIFNGSTIWRKDRDRDAVDSWPEKEIPSTGFGFSFPPGPPLQAQEGAISPGCGFSSNLFVPEESSLLSPSATSSVGVSQSATTQQPTPEQTTPAQPSELFLKQ